MTPLIFALVALAGGLGAAARLALDGIIRTRVSSAFPWATIIINVTGSLLLGVLAGLAAGHLVSDASYAIVGAGFLGGYTTFSTASFETVRLLQERKWLAGAVNGLGVLAATTLAAALGVWIGGTLS
ncbi:MULTISPECIES: CrcB family protein [unclassified Microbacterium]|uniref:fluoride efflux transporter FluC n=1 Tax=unclassified Microbacterium TaxID=2609290 RepID=UPI000C2B7A9D|nr:MULTISPECIES: CrcB family protein [unclassified Microbacterium]